MIHPFYDDDNLHNDIALLQTSRPMDIKGSKGYINGVCLPDNKKDPTGFATVSGWGHEFEGRSIYFVILILMNLFLDISHRKNCNFCIHNDLLSKFKIISEFKVKMLFFKKFFVA